MNQAEEPNPENEPPSDREGAGDEDATLEEQEEALGEALEALLDLAEDDPGEALAMFATLPAEVQALPQFRFEQAALLRDTTALAEARTLLAELVAEYPDDSDAHHLLADVLEDLDEEQAAATHFLRTLELDQREYEQRPAPERQALIAEVEAEARRVVPGLPQPWNENLALVKFKVSTLPSKAQVEAGMDPRAQIHLHDEPDGDDDESTQLAGTFELFASNIENAAETTSIRDQLKLCIALELAALFDLDDEELETFGLDLGEPD